MGGAGFRALRRGKCSLSGECENRIRPAGRKLDATSCTYNYRRLDLAVNPNKRWRHHLKLRLWAARRDQRTWFVNGRSLPAGAIPIGSWCIQRAAKFELYSRAPGHLNDRGGLFSHKVYYGIFYISN